ncbi:MAG: hypothetical protein M1830_008526 [Pleopsidium flavum]|nr:MAG: hypothetical protein M1830_008526 [Pleopsidium flavum]
MDNADLRPSPHTLSGPERSIREIDTFSPASLSGADGVRLDHEQHENALADIGVSHTTELRGINDRGNGGYPVGSAANSHRALDECVRGRWTDSLEEEAPHLTLHYYRHLGPTAIAPGHKKISLKVRQDVVRDTYSGSDWQSRDCGTFGISNDTTCLPLFDGATSLPSKEILPQLLDRFFEYYGDNFCFLHRPYLSQLIERGEASSFLICSMSALSSRFCQPEMFTKYFMTKANGQERERWEFSLPFLERAKKLLMPLLSIPSCDVVAGMLLLSWVEFGDNNEAGLWMFSGMALRMAQELGLHREHTSTGPSIGQSPANIGSNGQEETMFASASPFNCVGMEAFERSSQIILFWCIFTQDTCLSSGTGRVPSIKRHEISIRLPEDIDIAVIQAGPEGVPEPIRDRAYPQLVRMMLAFAPSIETLNTDSSQCQSSSDRSHRMDLLEELKCDILQNYQLVPQDIRFGAIFYQAAVESRQAGPYLVLHLFFHLQIAFLTQESLSLHEELPGKPCDIPATNDGHLNPVKDDKGAGSARRKMNEELYRNAIRSITDLLTFAKLIDNRALLATFFLNQSFFHAACAYIRDMLEHMLPQLPTTNEPSTFPIPSQISPSMVFHVDNHNQDSVPPTKSFLAAESTFSYLSLIAKTNYHFLRQSVKDMAKFYAGAGWVDAVLDQRETGLRDVDLSIVSEAISTFIRLHDLRGRCISGQALKGTPIPASNENSSMSGLKDHDVTWAELSSDFLGHAEPEFDPLAFFDDYMFTGKTFSSTIFMLVSLLIIHP